MEDWSSDMLAFWAKYAEPALVAQATEALAAGAPEEPLELALLWDALTLAGEGPDPHNPHMRVKALNLISAAYKAAKHNEWGGVLDEAHSLWLHAAKGPLLRAIDTVRAAAPMPLWGRARDGWDTVRGVSQSPHRVVRASLNAVFNGMHAFSWAEEILTQSLRDRYPHDAGDTAQTTSHYTLALDRRVGALVERQLDTIRRWFRLPDPRVVVAEPPPPKPPLVWEGPPVPDTLPPVGRYDVTVSPMEAAEVGVLDYMALPPEWDSWDGYGMPVTPEDRARRPPARWQWTDNSKRAGVRHYARVKPTERIPLHHWAAATGADVVALTRAISEGSLVGPANLALDLARRALERVERACPQGDDYVPALGYAIDARKELDAAERLQSRIGPMPIRLVWARARTALDYAAEAARLLGIGAEVERAQQRDDLLALVAR